jgi:uncharacterized membrane protein YvlD (DUF360 family)
MQCVGIDDRVAPCKFRGFSSFGVAFFSLEVGIARALQKLLEARRLMGYLIVNWVVGSIGLLVVASLLPGFRVTWIEAALLVAGTVGLLSAAIASAVRQARGAVNASMTWALVFLADALLFRVTALAVPGFAMRGFAPAFVGAAMLVFLSVALARIETLWLDRAASESAPNS